MNFLRSKVTEIARTGLSNRQTNDATQSFSGDDSTTVFTLTNTPVCVSSVTIGGTEQTAFLDYQIDLDNKKITFTTAPTTGTNNIVVTHDTGSNWVYVDVPRDDLAKASYPRVGITVLTETGKLQGLAADDTFDSVTFQIDCVAYKDQACTNAGSDKIQGMDVADLLARRVRSAVKDNWRGKLLSYALFNPSFINNIPLPFDEPNNLFRRVVTIGFNALNIGE